MSTSCRVSRRGESSSGSRIMGFHHPVAAGERRPGTSRKPHRDTCIPERTDSNSDEIASEAGREALTRVLNCQKRVQNCSNKRVRVATYVQRAWDRTVARRVVNTRLSVHDQWVSETPRNGRPSETERVDKPGRKNNPNQKPRPSPPRRSRISEIGSAG